MQQGSVQYPNNTIIEWKTTLSLKNIESPSRIQLYPAYNNTFVLWDNSWVKKHLLHVSSTGDTISQLIQIENFTIHQLLMMSSRITVILMTKTNDAEHYYLLQWNFQIQEHNVYSYKLSEGTQKNLPQIFGFPQHHLIYIVESQIKHKTKNAQSQSNIVISSYPFPLSNNNGKQLHTYQAQLYTATMAQKYNNRSSIYWKQPHTQERTILCTYDYKNNSNKIDTIVIQHQLCCMPSLQKDRLYSVNVKDIWEIQEGLLYIHWEKGLDSGKVRKNGKFQLGQIQMLISEEMDFHYLWYTHQKQYIPIYPKSQNLCILQFMNGFRKTQRFTRSQIKKFNYTPTSLMMPSPKYQKLPYTFYNYTQNISHRKEKLQIKGYDYMSKQYKECFPEYNVRLHQSLTWKSIECDVEVSINLTRISGLVWSSNLVAVFFIGHLVEQCQEDLLDYVCGMIGE